MRSRYTAYATGAVSHLMRTTSARSPHRGADAREWRADLEAYCRAVTFEGLTVLGSSVDGDQGRVQFFARLTAGGRDASFGEDSAFVRVDGAWAYVDGARIDVPG